MKLIVANLKMNLLYGDLKNYKEKMEQLTTANQLVICPSSLFIPFLGSDKYNLGSQNVYYEKKGSFTGEISAMQLKSLGVSYVIIGHSERRNYFKEDNITVNKKCLELLANDIKPIICVGESKTERLENNTYDVIKKQLEECLYNVTDLSNVIIAYEPLWAIGTGIIPTLTEINDVGLYIKNQLKNMTESIKVLYGGSVDNENIEAINSVNSIDGFLIGSASINPSDFATLINKVK